jgi:3-hydroxy-3-methylglutaryl CoA synthase
MLTSQRNTQIQIKLEQRTILSYRDYQRYIVQQNMATKQVRSSKGIFVPNESCAINNKHHEWYFDNSKKTLKRMRDLQAQLVEIMCEAGRITLTLKYGIVYT